MFIRTRASVENVTPQKAKTWLDNNYDHNRKLRAKRVTFYSKEMERGKWKPTNPIAFAYIPSANKQILINGQHTLKAVIQSGVTLNQYPIVQYTVDNPDDVADLYAHFDIGQTRTYSDSLKAYGIPDRTGLSLSNLNKLSAALSYMTTGFSMKSPQRALLSHDDMIDLVFDWLDEFKDIENAIAPCQNIVRNKIFLRSILAVALITWRHQPHKALTFWRQVAQTNRLAKNDPRLALHKVMMQMSASGGAGNSLRQFRPGEFSRVTAYAWNKYFTGASLAHIKINVATKINPILIKGTPYNGKSDPTQSLLPIISI